MKHTYLCTLAALMIGGPALQAQSHIDIPYGQEPLIDGVITAGEWNDAHALTIAGSPATTVLIKYTASHLYLAYAGNLESAGRFPELLVDGDNDRSAGWQDDDWWFHVSATDCESRGEPAVYNACAPDHPDWDAAPNMTPSPTDARVDTIEVAVPLAKIGLAADSRDTFGIAFVATNTFSLWRYWPEGADLHSPAGWGTAVLLQPTSSVHSAGHRREQSTVAVFPNPLTDHTSLSLFIERSGPVELSIVDVLGGHIRTVLRGALPAGQHTISWDGRTDGGERVSPGQYLYRLHAPGSTTTGLLQVAAQ